MAEATSRSAAQAGTADGGKKTTLGDLAERLEKALAKQASSLSGQLQLAADAESAPSPAINPAQSPTDSIEAWERGELTPSSQQAADAAPQAAPAPEEPEAEPDAAPDEQPRQSQAMLEDETDSGVIEFSDRKKASPGSKSSDSLEDEMARLLGELTDATSGR